MAAPMRLSCALLCALALSAAPAAFAQTNEQTPVLGALPPQPLERGKCGLFLWSRDGRQDFVLVAYDNPARARVKLDGALRDFPRVSLDGESAGGHFEHQRYADDRATLDLTLRFDGARPVPDGAIIEEGVLRIIRPDGWESVHAVGGIAACKR